MECPSCLHENQLPASECEKCKRPLRPQGKRTLTSNLRLVLHCDACGAQNRGLATHCADCGSALSRQKLMLKAPVLGSRDRELVHYLVCPPLVPVKLVATEECIIGRSDDSCISLPGELVSRHHARISSDENGFRLEDLGSANGTFYNDQRLEEPVRLLDGDRISIGGFQITHVIRRGHGARSSSNMLRDDTKTPTRVVELEAVLVAAAELEGVSAAGSFSGRLDEVPLVAVMEFLRDHSHSGLLRVSTSTVATDSEPSVDALAGSIHFGGGDIVDAHTEAVIGASSGRDAIFRLAALPSGRFAFVERPWDGSREITDATGLILQELQAQTS